MAVRLPACERPQIDLRLWRRRKIAQVIDRRKETGLRSRMDDMEEPKVKFCGKLECREIHN